eukprot:CAMPEP_0176197772 /NCGR_PEP_ID=MMETSP0121_2-20121125/7713_1 /TAXON_ID=160619 /ORGANISM="Kryptoperidinium foliaceum, Strain CCMP 1326" /LENGTH=415 /DNA_ID=CAMNT_0017536609 /DNA_START=67 /DNA_END=1314 /DNA_ORIENTATION=+
MAAARGDAPIVDKKVAKEGGKERIDCLDACCATLVLPIMLAHTARFGTSNKAALRLLTQENILVGGFFAILGYIAAYSSTKVGERKADERLARPEMWFWGKVMSYYPVHALVSTLFAPMFIAADTWYGTPLKTTAFRAFLNYSLLQAWFPKQAAIWNQPSWFLSALTSSNLVMPAVLKRTAALSKLGLQKLFCAVTAVSVLMKLSFSNTSRFHEHNIVARGGEHALVWNMTRFHPITALLEMVTGVVAARSVMLDTEEDKKRREEPLVYFAAAYGSLLLRATPFDFNDGLVRSALFVPLYSRFLASLHRDCHAETPSPFTQLLRSGPLNQLGSLTFSMFVLHAPLAQLFFKKSVATPVFGGPMPRSFFPVYLLIVFLASGLVNEGFIKNDFVQQMASSAAKRMATLTKGMLQDTD